MRLQSETKPVVSVEILVAQEQIADLSRQVAELSKQVASQAARPIEDTEARREIAELKARLQIAEGRAAEAEAFASTFRSETAKNEQAAKADETKIDSILSTFKETQTKIDRVATQATQSESAIRQIGPLRFSGDFRLRADAIWRPAFTNPNVAVVTAGNLGPTGAVIGSTLSIFRLHAIWGDRTAGARRPARLAQNRQRQESWRPVIPLHLHDQRSERPDLTAYG